MKKGIFLLSPRRINIRQFRTVWLFYMMLSIFMLLTAILTILYLLMCSTNCKGWRRENGLEHFKWAPYVDVKSEVERQLLGEPAQSFIINNWTNFGTIIEPNCIGWAESAAAGDERKHKEILVIVKTAPNRLERREAIRSTFGAFKGDKAEDGWAYRIRTVFVMGAMVNWQTNWTAQLKEEAHRYGDLLVGNHQDDYYRQCFKFANSIKMARNFCGRQKAVDFVMLLDDDYLLFPWELIKEAQRHSPDERLYGGFCHENSPTIRDWHNKWAISYREYPYEKYPAYCNAGSVLLTRRTVEEFYLAIQHAEFLIFDDVYAGILAHLLQIPAQHNAKYFTHQKIGGPIMASICIEELEGKKWPWCNDWRDVISAHGYSPMEIRQIYPRIQHRWMNETGKKAENWICN